MAIKHAQLTASLERGLAPVYLVGGAEPLLVQESRDEIIAAARAAGFEMRDLLQVGAGFDWQELAGAASAPSLFASRRVLDLRLPSGKPGREGARVLSDWCAAPDPDTLLLVSCDDWDASARKAKWAAAFDQAGVRVDIWPIAPRELPRWIDRRMRVAGLDPAREAVLLLADRVEGNLLAAQQEIDKLALQKGGGAVSEADVLQVVADSSRFDAFALCERVLAGDLAGSLRIASGLRRTGVPIQLVTGALVRELRTLEAFRDAVSGGEPEMSVFRRLRVWQSRQGALRQAARRVGAGRLAQAFARLARLDRQGKGREAGDPWQELDHLVTGLCR